MTLDLTTNAERSADLSRNLPNFRNLSLPGIKNQVAQFLKLIGRQEIFSSYTIHDITHIDAMLSMLDWLVPESTRSLMTPLDWLLTVLSIYFHDLGMVTTAQEFDARHTNSEFMNWQAGLDKSADGKEYLARTNRMSAEEKDRFFFQEFIRKGHPQRIREWITGRHSITWGSYVQPIADQIADLLKHAPSRFRDSLALACESHHRANLEQTDKYPLAARFGNDPGEIANIQYAAILLRTADLLHVTKDRTPSAMYQSIRFSDPKSVEEWDKQVGTFAVGPKGRALIEGNPETAVVVVNADFTEERPLFSLQEYIAYADSEIRQSKRWADKSQESSDAKDYSFPWHKVDGDVRLEGVPPQPMRFELDRGRLLDLLVGHTIYNDPTVAVRELLQNAIDAVRFFRHLEETVTSGGGEGRSTPGTVTVSWSPNSRTLKIQDNGVGMDRDTIKHHLMNVGSSYYNTPQFEAEHKNFVPISRFGIGILTCFMVSDNVEIVTIQKSMGHRIKMTSVKSTYLLRELEPGNQILGDLGTHGTRVTLILRDTVDLSARTVLDIVKYWIILPECTVLYQEDGKEAVKVGFASVADALRSYHSLDELPDQYNKLDIIVKSRANVEGDTSNQRSSFELAFAVYSGYFPERTFARIKSSDAPRVCIEGIRVAQALPGFESGETQLSALLAVRGSRQFRTTVSRAGLEDDDEFSRVVRLCVGMLLEHIEDEVRRISNKPGKPLSQAARGCRFLSDSLRASASHAIAYRSWDGLISRLPSMVLEQVEENSNKPTATRKLISPVALRDIRTFWTIESRAVDSLGMISLDLGRELSLNEFLLALAPDVTQLRYSPILSDAQWALSDVLARHSADRVEFSKQHQQTAIAWSLRTTPDMSLLNILAGGDAVFSQKVTDHVMASQTFRTAPVTFQIRMQSSKISGDDTRIRVIRSRMGIILEEGSDFAKAWHAIRAASLNAVQNRDVPDLLCVYFIAKALHLALSGGRRLPYLYGAGTDPGAMWREHLPRFKTILERVQMKVDLPSDLSDWARDDVVFDATDYWRKWERSDKNDEF